MEGLNLEKPAFAVSTSQPCQQGERIFADLATDYDFEENYGAFEERAIAWESSTATAIMLAGANILVLWHPDVIKELKSFMEEE